MSDMYKIAATIVVSRSLEHPSVGVILGTRLWNMGYDLGAAARIANLYDAGVRDGRMPDAALVIGEQIERERRES